MFKNFFVMASLIPSITQCAAQKIEIMVNANPSTGYSWQYTCDPQDGATVEKVKQDKNAPQKKSDRSLVGSPIQEIYRVTKRGKGPVTCSFSYSRPWEKDMPPVQYFSIKL